jgi:hypothetical protein
MISKVYELGLAEGYVSSWGLTKAVNELIQNAIDSEAPFEYQFAEESLVISSPGVTLSPRHLLLGASTKRDCRQSIGQFGEGFKLAMLVLVRMGYGVTCHNGEVIWRPGFTHSETFGENTLQVQETANPGAERRLSFEIDGLSMADVEAIKDSCLQMQPPIRDAIETSRGQILPSRPGKLYVNGLFVCDTGLKYGYNMKPAYIQLERDRNTVENWRIQFVTKDMWIETKRWSLIANEAQAEVPDFAYAQHGANDQLREACHALFTSESAGALLARNERQATEMRAQGAIRVAVTGSDAFYELVTSSKAYQVTKARLAADLTPKEQLDRWYDDHKRYLARLPKTAFKKLRDRAASWKTGTTASDIGF